MSDIKFMGVTMNDKSTCKSLHSATLTQKIKQFNDKCYITNVSEGAFDVSKLKKESLEKTGSLLGGSLAT